MLGGDDRAHAFLGLAHQDLFGTQRRVAQQHPIQPDVHAAVAVAGQLAGGARDPRPTQVLDAFDESGAQDFERALDEELLHEGVAHLDAGALCGAGLVERLTGQHRHSADPVAAGTGAVEDHQVAHPLGARQVDVLVLHGAHTQRVDQRVALIGLVEDDLTTDVRQAQTVAVSTDARHDSREHPFGVGVVSSSEAQRVHDSQRPGAHRDDVTHNAPDTGGRTLVGLHIRGVVVALDLEGHRPPVADVHHSGVLADADQQRVRRRRLLTELAQMDLAGLVGAVFAPHDRVHRQLARRGPATQDLPDPVVLIGLEAQLGVRLISLRGVPRGIDRVQRHPHSSPMGPQSMGDGPLPRATVSSRRAWRPVGAGRASS